MKIILLVVSFFFFFSSNAHAFTALCVAVSDGDTITVETQQGERLKVRLYGIDSPEKGQLFGTPAKEFVKELILNKSVFLDVQYKDRYKRIVAIVRLDESTLQENLVSAGYAWIYPQYCKLNICKEWEKKEIMAQSEKKGLWKQESPLAPWEWRRKK